MPAIVDEQTSEGEGEHGEEGRVPPQGGGRAYPLAGLLRSASGRAITGSGATSTTGRTYWCYCDTETGEHWPQDELEGAVYGAVVGALSEPGVAETVADLVISAQEEAIAGEMGECSLIRKRLASIKAEESNALDMAIRLGARDSLAEKVRVLGEERDQLQARLDALEHSAPMFTHEHVLFWLESVIAQGDVATLVAAFVSQIVLDGDSVR